MTINNNNIFGAFTLNEARGSRLTGDWLNKESVANYGWFGGGRSQSFPAIETALVDRIDFSNDSVAALARGSLSLARYISAATGNSNYGWFGGGRVLGPVQVSTVDRIDFSNDSATASVRGPLSLVRESLAATGNSNYGWFGGGLNPGTPGTGVSTVDRIDFSNDSGTASLRGPLSSTRYSSAATGNSNYGWFGGGSPGTVSTVNRIDFSNDFATASPRGSLSSARKPSAATGNSNYGWFGGGDNSIPVKVSTVDRIDFSNDLSTASLRGPLSLVRNGTGATGNSNYGWFGGGLNLTPALVSTVDRVDFSNDTSTASPRGGGLSAARDALAATSGVLNIRRQKAGNYGWFGGGRIPAGVSTVDRIDFSNDSSTASPRGLLSSARYSMGATGNSNYGWFGGGFTTVVVSTVDRIDFSNDSATASPRGGALSLERRFLAAAGNSNYGWFGGGAGAIFPPTSYATVDRIDFSNDSATASVRGPLSSARYQFAATGNSNYGWFGGGVPTTATVERINFSNDSPSLSIRGPLSLARYNLAATGNSNYGWFGGGVIAPPITALATVDRIDFSNDSPSLSIRGPLSLARYNLAATGNSNYGWFGGGYLLPTVYSRVDRIDFSNDSTTASVRGSITPATGKHAAGATSNTNK
jgi:hypothetical protein